jgi:glycosyltransferase involved in cell wall biosynthesis
MEFDASAKAPDVVMLTADRQIDRRILLEADALEGAGWRVTIVALPLDTPAADEDPRVVRVRAASIGAAREALVRVSYRWVRRWLPMNSPLMRTLKSIAWRYLVDPESLFRKLFAGAIDAYSPAVFVAHDLPMLPVASPAAARCGAKLVYDSHELFSEQDFSAYERRRWAQIEKKHIGACDAVITVNPSIARELERRYGLLQVHVIYNAERSLGASDAPLGRQWRFHDAFGLSRESKLLLLQGGLSAGRNIETLVRAMSLVRNAAVHLVILGDGQLKSRLEAIIRDLTLSSRVHLHPAVAQRELLGYTVSADAGIIPYQATCLNNLYCTPNKLFEFIASALPVLGSDLPEIRRIITENGIGQVADLSSREAIAASIEEFFRDDGRLKTWHAHALEARKVVCWEREGEKLASIYGGLR